MFAKVPPTPVDAGAHRSERTLENIADLLIGKALDVTEDNGGTELLRQTQQGFWIVSPSS